MITMEYDVKVRAERRDIKHIDFSKNLIVIFTDGTKTIYDYNWNRNIK